MPEASLLEQGNGRREGGRGQKERGSKAVGSSAALTLRASLTHTARPARREIIIFSKLEKIGHSPLHYSLRRPGDAGSPTPRAVASCKLCRWAGIASRRLLPYTDKYHDPSQAIYHRVRPVMPEEYDEAVRRCPDLCPLILAGDRRTGAQVAS